MATRKTTAELFAEAINAATNGDGSNLPPSGTMITIIRPGYHDDFGSWVSESVMQTRAQIKYSRPARPVIIGGPVGLDNLLNAEPVHISFGIGSADIRETDTVILPDEWIYSVALAYPSYHNDDIVGWEAEIVRRERTGVIP